MCKYEELKKQVETELRWMIEANRKEKNPSKEVEDFNRGAIFAYERIMSKIKYLEENET